MQTKKEQERSQATARPLLQKTEISPMASRTMSPCTHSNALFASSEKSLMDPEPVSGFLLFSMPNRLGSSATVRNTQGFNLHVDISTLMAETTTVRVSKKTKAKLESVSTLSGINNLSKTLDFAVEAAEDRLNHYHGNIDSLLKFRAGRSGFRHTSEEVDKVLAQAFSKKGIKKVG